MQRAFYQARIGLLVLAERHDTRDAGRLGARLRCANCGMSRLRRRRRPARRRERSRPWRRRSCERAEEFEMHRRDRGDHRDMRAHQPRQRLDLAGVIHAHFQHRVARARRTARQRQRHAPMIVVGGDRGVGLAVFRQREPQRSLVPVLPTEPVTPITLALAARARRGGEIAQSRQHIGDDEERRIAGKSRAGPRRRPRAGSGRERGATNSWPSCDRPQWRRRPRPADGAAVDRNAGNGLRQRAVTLGAHRRRHCLRRSTARGRSCGNAP
jgi:hypothetical protein